MTWIAQNRLALACLVLSAGCASERGLQIGGGARGFFSYTREIQRRTDTVFGDDSPDYNWTNLRGRALAAEATVGVSGIDLVSGIEWTHVEGEYFRTGLCGVRVRLRDRDDGSGLYAELLGRSVLESEGGPAFFDGFHLGVGVLSPIAHGVSFDCGVHWIYFKHAAIRPESDAVSQIWVGVGIRFDL
ncbi:MAG: hypothetical protein JNL28_10900 [Planctomycetes bacterium]|nr:hypothetical protein [Planctomycetota bacterium]